MRRSSMVDENGGQSGKPPGVYFTYELSPIRCVEACAGVCALVVRLRVCDASEERR